MLVYVFCVCVNLHVYYVCTYVYVCMCVYLFVLVCDRPKRQWSGWGQRRGGHTSQTSGGGPQQLAKLGCGAQICFGISDERNNQIAKKTFSYELWASTTCKVVVVGPNNFLKLQWWFPTTWQNCNGGPQQLNNQPNHPNIQLAIYRGAKPGCALKAFGNPNHISCG